MVTTPEAGEVAGVVAVAAGDVEDRLPPSRFQKPIGRRDDDLIVRTVPGVRKAVRWNTPFYGVEGKGWFLGFHCFTKYVKVTFLRGTALRPLPPGESKHKDVRYLDIYEGKPFDEALVANWIKQASALPGDALF